MRLKMVVELYGLALWWHLPREAQQILHDLFCALRLLQYDAQIPSRSLR